MPGTDKVEALVTKKTRWILKKLLFQRDRRPPKPKEYVSGESFSYLGGNYRLKVESGPFEYVTLKSGKLTVHVPSRVRKRDRYIRNALVGWYREHALNMLQDKVARYSKVVGVVPSSVGIKTFKSRWGSCSSNGHIQFNWKIIIAPNPIVDYVVVHELCHLRHHNHSPDFWKCVEWVLADYRERKDWLRANGAGMVV